MSLADRFWPKVRKSDGCWEWQASLNGSGYGQIGRGGRGVAPLSAHRASWQINVGPIPTGMFVCHTCDNRKCVRPDHLFLGTHSDNMRDCVRKGRNRGRVSYDRMSGEGCVHAKLKRHEVMAIRHLAERYEQKDLAALYGLGTSAVCSIVNGKTWK